MYSTSGYASVTKYPLRVECSFLSIDSGRDFIQPMALNNICVLMTPRAISLPDLSPDLYIRMFICLLDISIWMSKRHLSLHMFQSKPVFVPKCVPPIEFSLSVDDNSIFPGAQPKTIVNL